MMRMAAHESHGGHPATSIMRTEDSSRSRATRLLKMELVQAIQTGRAPDAFERFSTLLNRLLSLRRCSVARSRVFSRTTKRKRDVVRANHYDYDHEHEEQKEEEAEVNDGEAHHPPERNEDDAGVLVAAVLNSSHDNLLTMAINEKLPLFVYSLLEARSDPCFVDEKRVPALNRACWGRCAIVSNTGAGAVPHAAGPWDTTSTPRMLLEYGADVNALDGNGVTPLYIALAAYSLQGGANTGLWKLLFLEYHADPYILCTRKKRQNPALPAIHETCVDLAMRIAVDDEGIFHREHSGSCLQFLTAVDHQYSKEYLNLARLQMEGQLPPWHSSFH